MPYELINSTPTSGVSRRTTLKWMIAGFGSASLAAACGQKDPAGASGSSKSESDQSYLGEPKPISGAPYGGDPTIMDPAITWELTMTPAQLQLASALSDVLLPADESLPSGSAVGVQDFINEWVSSPYEKTEKGRSHCFLLFEWLEGQSRETNGVAFAEAEPGQQSALLDRIAWRDRIEEGLEKQAEAFDTFRSLAVSAYFASKEGSEWLGYMGNQPIQGDYPGPSPEALEHLESGLTSLGLEMPQEL